MSPPSPIISRVNDLSIHFEKLSLGLNGDGNHSASGSDSEVNSGSLSNSASGSDVSQEKKQKKQKQVLTGENRIPLRQRLREMRKGVQERAQRRRESGSITDTIEAMVTVTEPTTTPPRNASPPRSASPQIETPIRPLSLAHLEVAPLELPNAPFKRDGVYDSRRLSSSSSNNNNDDDADHLLDRRANTHTEEEVESRRLSVEQANERSRQKVTTPSRPSSLWRSFNADDIDKLYSALGRLEGEEREAESREE
ncbi:uncharacterized protein GGS25DRAFT_519845 [Hypoxylon fragiforme]|uniref:uncharacterized protein n=1 Tax=Hypoxylon fragiforme TaxID=63214 RepID=UPI0020C72429|nr:uncharacterized protein GGS25DRAFT_519845 [Hypoxylon fragiforme]KAI2611539.1 hypothetical protein GGS25DRAFT_519845 [Hypoxylon fragiforme]